MDCQRGSDIQPYSKTFSTSSLNESIRYLPREYSIGEFPVNPTVETKTGRCSEQRSPDPGHKNLDVTLSIDRNLHNLMGGLSICQVLSLVK